MRTFMVVTVNIFCLLRRSKYKNSAQSQRLGPQLITKLFLPPPISTMAAIILVTGGNGLVGSAIRHIIETEPIGSKFGKYEGETWVFCKSSDGDLRSACVLSY